MIPNVQTGTSFRGAELYYLHDKRQKGELPRLSDERVTWTATRNTAHDAADYAFAEMIATAHDQDQLKLMSGARLSGRPCEQPVMTISLAWHPSEQPSKDDMLRAADSYLEHMEWADHQAVYVAHSDTAHPHMHIILNRIHPETGRVLDDAFSKNRTQEWARAYEQEHGRIWCEERIGKDYGRVEGNEPRSMPHAHAIDGREAQQRYAELEEAARSLDAREKDQLAKHHQHEREAFFETRHRQFREARQEAWQEVRGEYKERWVEHFREADTERHQAEQDGAKLALRVLECARQGDFAAAWETVSDRDALHRMIEQHIADERRQLRAEQREDTRQRQDEACAALYEERAQAYARMKQRQKEERAELRQLQAARADAHPYDKERLIELVSQPAAERLTDSTRQKEPNPHQRETDARAESADKPTDREPSLQPAEATPERAENRSAEPESQHGRIEGDGALITGASDALAGGIGKLAEVLAEAIAGLICPETEQDRAAKRAAAKAKPEPAPEPPVQQPQPRSSFSFDTFFGEHGDRLRREDEERRQKRNDRLRE